MTELLPVTFHPGILWTIKRWSDYKWPICYIICPQPPFSLQGLNQFWWENLEQVGKPFTLLSLNERVLFKMSVSSKMRRMGENSFWSSTKNVKAAEAGFCWLVFFRKLPSVLPLTVSLVRLAKNLHICWILGEGEKYPNPSRRKTSPASIMQ